MTAPGPRPPAPVPMCQRRCDLGAQVSPGLGPCGERRHVLLGGGTVRGPELEGARVEVQSHGLRHGPPEVMDRLARDETARRDADFFRTLMRLTTGHPDGLHPNEVTAIAAGQREARRVILDAYRLA